uniref:Ig-like domain-containing protein n=1 Tax=Zonotrichia albicollis TaxID=44394 RepID=A0A8D2M3C3_ZONAL
VSCDCGSFLLSAAVTGQVALEQQPREVTVREGDEFTFHCSLKEGDWNSYYMNWYRQGPRGSLEWIYEEKDDYGAGFKNHFKGSVENPRTTLQLLAAEQGDAATYYCGARPTLEQLCGRGTYFSSWAVGNEIPEGCSGC